VTITDVNGIISVYPLWNRSIAKDSGRDLNCWDVWKPFRHVILIRIALIQLIITYW
jgi:hypothetical protein